MTEGGQEATRADDEVVPAADVRKTEERASEIERQLSRKTLDVDILKDARDARARRSKK
jgi:transposase